ncbi:MAG TPA: DEAD/DEAH box helicase [Nitrospina sp.]|jgi:DEAD/DEAH box helicase domain-containing protein|nr:ribonuclease H-like domain-containing protein [Nitrospinaceae bacterium]MEE1551152.1 ribonuclease H-like domain-containing protein [Nitrospinaceae bacterium]HAX47144.1 DEAD/DEAH box helicase [Nitrospina sp.]HJL73220.1 ribonuclease H-like domain-containing protein [Nitrospinaceae bacterium]|tara:strand:- start:37 stop:672 length:636 start_codon:yes stop_codon:yes gene_type:complete
MPDQLDLFAEPEEITKIEPEAVPPTSNALRVLYFDLETQKSAADVGGWGNTHLMKLAVGVVWDSLEQKHFSYLESEADQLVAKLRTADLVVGFNVIGFDYPVLQPYARDFDLQEITTFDMLVDVKRLLNHRLSLDHLAQNTLNAQKSADGLVSLQWYKEGKIDKIVEYCKQDVEITRDLFLYGESNDHVIYKTRSGTVKELKVDWKSANLV